MSSHLVALTKHIEIKYPEGNFLYKSCSTDNDSWIVVLQLADRSITNQCRLSIGHPNRKYAKFRASKAKVIDIIHKFDQTKIIDSVKSSSHYYKIEYVKGTIVLPNAFDTNLSKVCSSGIHFFESIEAAFYYELDKLKNYTGHWTEWHQNGKKMAEHYFRNGISTGYWTEWKENGQKKFEGYYTNGQKFVNKKRTKLRDWISKRLPCFCM
jgi:antitoxin component YwqK of YwqJK toxin-antitoxin module